MTGGGDDDVPATGVGSRPDFLYSSEELGDDDGAGSAAAPAVGTGGDGGAFNSPSENFTPFMSESALVPAAPKAVGRHLNGVEVTRSGSLLVSSVAAGNADQWTGSLWLWRTPDDALDVAKSVAGIEIPVGVVDFAALDAAPSQVVIGWASGPVEVLDVVEPDVGPAYFTTLADGRVQGNQLTALSYSNELSVPITGTADGCIQVWQIRAESLIPTETIPFGHTASVSSICAKNPVNKTGFLSCSLDDGTVMIWDRRSVRTSASCLEYPVGIGPSVVSWDPDDAAGNTFVVGDTDGAVKWFDSRNLADAVRAVQVDDITVRRIAWNHSKGSEGRMMAVGCDSMRLNILACAGSSWELRSIPDVHLSFVRGLAWDEKMNLYSCGLDGRLVRTAVGFADEPELPGEVLGCSWPSFEME